MSGAELAALVTAIGGFAGGVFAAARSLGSGRTESIQTVLKAYRNIVDDLQEELERLQVKVRELEDSDRRKEKRIRFLETMLLEHGVEYDG